MLRATAPPGARIREYEGEPSGLIDAWEGEGEVVLVDAVSSGAPPGTVHRLDPLKGPLPAELFRRSTHHLGVTEAVELARALDRLSDRLEPTSSRPRRAHRPGRAWTARRRGVRSGAG